jgi:peptidoglycan hydrolase-like amidase
LSQYGAYAQALAGRNHVDILRHYFTGVNVGGDSRVPGEIAVGLLQEQDVIRVRTGSRNGAAPSRSIVVNLGNGTHDVVWCGDCGPHAVTFEGAEFVLRDQGGAEKGRGPGPVRIDYEFLDGNPSLLRLPQLLSAPDQAKSEATLAAEGKRAGSYQWGRLDISRMDSGRLRAVMVLPMQRYLAGLAEMPSSWHPEALRAQAIAGRTYATRKVQAGIQAACGCHLGATPADQVYAGWAKEGEPTFGIKWVDAVNATSGVAVASGSSLAQTYYSSSHGGRTENSQDSWAFSTPFPYLVSVDDPWSLDPAVNNPFARWSATLDNRRFADTAAPGIVTLASVRPVGERTAGGTPRELEVGGWDASGNRKVERYTGGTKGIAGAGVKLAFPAELRSQQIATLGFTPFEDDEGSVHEYNIWAIEGKGITSGCDGADPTRYCPNGTVTRGQMATFLAAALGLDINAGGNRFDDTSASVHRGAIEAIAEAGITQGCDGADPRRFCPTQQISRGQMATFLTAAFDLPGAGGGRFTDTDGSVHAGAIDAVAGAGITNGCAADRFCPRDPVLRGQMATFLAYAGGYGW